MCRKEDKLPAPCSRDELAKIISYDPETGEFLRLTGMWKGRKAGSDRNGSQIRVHGKLYYAHKLAWYLMTGEWPDDDVDHEDRNRRNNKWSNLRVGTRAQNNVNTIRKDSNQSVYQLRSGQWRMYVSIEGKHKSFGPYKTKELALEARRAKMSEMYGEEWLPRVV